MSDAKNQFDLYIKKAIIAGQDRSFRAHLGKPIDREVAQLLATFETLAKVEEIAERLKGIEEKLEFDSPRNIIKRMEDMARIQAEQHIAPQFTGEYVPGGVAPIKSKKPTRKKATAE
jgi:hypothetical protein